MIGNGWKSATPIWELVLALTLAGTVIALTCVGWVTFLKQSRSLPRRKALVAGLTILTGFLGMGSVLFFLPTWIVPSHDSVGVGWFFAFPIVMLVVLASGIAAWRSSGKAIVGASVAGLSLWLLVAATVAI